MARWSRGRRRDDDGDDHVDLSSPEHAWWAAPEQPAAKQAPADVAESPSRDPYEVLGVPPSATWEEITAAHRRLAKEYHPDGLADGADWQREAREHMIRDLNVAYNELRVRKGR